MRSAWAYAWGNPISALRITRKGQDTRTVARALDLTVLGAVWFVAFDIKAPWATAYRLLILMACRKTWVFPIALDLTGDEDGAYFCIPADVEKMGWGRRVELSELAAKQRASIPRRDEVLPLLAHRRRVDAHANPDGLAPTVCREEAGRVARPKFTQSARLQ
jgi:hypothetical protein